MSRRIALVMVAVVAGALLLAGVGTLVLVDRANTASARAQLLHQVHVLSSSLGTGVGTPPAAATQPETLRVVRSAEHLLDARVVRVDAAGSVVVPGGNLPTPAVQATRNVAHRLRLARPALVDLYRGEAVSGTGPGLVFAAAPLGPLRRLAGDASGPVRVAVVLVRATPGAGIGLSYLLLASGAALLVAGLVGLRLSGAITRPLRSAVDATRRIAAGDLGAVVPPPPAAYPELASLADSINTMTASLARSKDLERQFLLAVSHDLRTPLTSIRGFAEAIADGLAPDPVHAATVVSAEARRLERLVGDLLELARLDAQSFSLHLQVVDLADVARVSAEGFRPTLAELDINLVTKLPPAGLWAVADPDRVAQVLANLLENAQKFAAAEISVEGYREGGRLVLRVADDGPGIDPSDLPRVFERMYTSLRRPARQAGTGLGLAIVAELASAMGATVTATSPAREGIGTALAVSFPPAPGPAPQEPRSGSVRTWAASRAPVAASSSTSEGTSTSRFT